MFCRQSILSLILLLSSGEPSAQVSGIDSSGITMSGPTPQTNNIRSMSEVFNEEGVTELMRAIRDGEEKTVKSLLKQTQDLSAKDSEGWTAITYAIIRDDTSTIKALISKGAKGSSSDVSRALARGKNDIASLLRKATIVDPPRAETPYLPPTPAGTLSKAVQLNQPRPSYTEEARKGGVEGVVRMLVLIDEQGYVKMIRVPRGLPKGLTYQAVDSARQLRFKPATMDGKPIVSATRLEIEFRLRWR